MNRFDKSACGSVVITGFLFMASSLCAQVPGDLVQNSGFETGSFSPWTTTGDPSETFVSLAFPYSGAYGVVFGAPDSPDFISQSLATSAGQAYTLSFWFSSGDNEGGTPNRFIVKWGDTTVLDQPNLVSPVWTNMQFSVTATSAQTLLTFGAYDQPDYILLDDISVATPSLVDRPQILGIKLTDGSVAFSWSAVLGRLYQVQFKTAVGAGNWTNLGSAVTATNTKMTASDSVGPDRQRFYRVLLSD